MLCLRPCQFGLQNAVRSNAMFSARMGIPPRPTCFGLSRNGWKSCRWKGFVFGPRLTLASMDVTCAVWFQRSRCFPSAIIRSSRNVNGPGSTPTMPALSNVSLQTNSPKLSPGRLPPSLFPSLSRCLSLPFPESTSRDSLPVRSLPDTSPSTER